MGQSRDKRNRANRSLIWQQFSRDELADTLMRPEWDFAEKFGMVTTIIEDPHLRDENYYHFLDNGSDILAVAHLDTVVDPDQRGGFFVNSEAGWVVHSGALDDRLGAYTILELLPKLGLKFDVLLTVGEEAGRSTAEHFTPPEGKDYKWIIEFDRGGSDVVMYQYHDEATEALVRGSGARVGRGSYSDIAYLEHLGRKAFNWGIGYQGDYHSVRGFAFLEDTVKMVAYFLEFHRNNADTTLPHVKKTYTSGLGGGMVGGIYGYGSYGGGHDHSHGGMVSGFAGGGTVQGSGGYSYRWADGDDWPVVVGKDGDDIEDEELTDEELAAKWLGGDDELDAEIDDQGRLIDPETGEVFPDAVEDEAAGELVAEIEAEIDAADDGEGGFHRWLMRRNRKERQASLAAYYEL